MTIANVGLTTNTRARVTVTVEISITDNWGGTTEVNQIVGQAKDSALTRLRSVLLRDFKIIGEPTVTMILVDGKE